MFKATRIAYSYLRFSTKGQKLGDSERRQLEGARRWCEDNGVTLDESLGIDEGVSAFKGANATKGVLSRFLRAVEKKTVKVGSIFIIENVDRLSRQDPWDAFKLIQKIVDAGIAIVTSQDRQEYSLQTMKQNPGQIYILWGAMQRAHNESQTKSDRISQKWSKTHELSRAKDFKALANLPKWKGGRKPGWIDWDDTKKTYVLNKDKSAIVRRIVKMSIDGHGAQGISQILNRERVPTFSSRTKHWEFSTIQRMVRGRSLIGDFQPGEVQQTDEGTRRQVPVGEPITGYYPSVIDEKTFYRLQSVIEKRRQNRKGRQGKFIANLFGSILKSGHDGSTMYFTEKRATCTRMISSAATKGLSDCRATFMYQDFESAFLKWVVEIELAFQTETIDNVDALEGKLSELQNKIKKLEKQLDDASDLDDRLIQILKKWTGDEKEFKSLIEAEREKRYATVPNTNEVRKLVAQMNKLPDDERYSIRLQLKTAIQSIVKEIKVYIYQKPRFAWILYAHVKFVDGLDRVFAVQRRRGEQAKTLSDDLKWQIMPDKLYKDWFDIVGADFVNATEQK